MVDGPVTDAPAQYDGEWDAMVSAGVESARVTLRWSSAQPYASFAQVPPEQLARFADVGGVPTDFSATDAVVAAAARRHVEVLAVVWSTPLWAAEAPTVTAPPRDRAAFRRFLAALIARYGPAGSLWSERPDLPRKPIRAWQIWNEPSLRQYWHDQPFARPYVRLLRAARSVLRAGDAGAELVLAGLPNRSWESLREIYRAGGRGQFDAVALHPYTREPRDVLRIAELSRRVMERYGDARTPVWLSELSWPAAVGKVARAHRFDTTDGGQALRLGRAVRRLAGARRRLRIERVVWYTWLSVEGGANSFAWSGLRRVRAGALVDAPALAVFRAVARALEGCAKPAGDASRCA